MVNSLEKALDAWIAKANFKCTYTQLEGTVADELAASAYPEVFEKCTLDCNGRFVKLGNKAILSQNVKFDLYEPTQAMNGVWAISDVCAADYIPQTEGGPPMILSVYEREREQKNIASPIAPQIECLIPIAYASGPALPNPITLMRILQKKAINAKIVTTNIETHLICVSLNFEEQNGNKNEYSIIINTEHSYPVPTQMVSQVTYSDGKCHVSKCEASDFVDVGNGVRIPRSISYFDGPMLDWRGKAYQGKWLVKKWKSEDLGNESPTNNDFLMQLAAGTQFSGFEMRQQDKLKNEHPTVFDFNSLSLNDLQNPITVASAKTSSASSGILRMVLMVGGAAMIIIACIQIWKNRSLAAKN
ncbi:MAG: hypothetical protein ACRC2T_19860 [Thermoguttaceae bacterium]